MCSRLATLLFLLCAGCNGGRECLETCEQVVLDGCPTAGMASCEVLCLELDDEAMRAGCVEPWGDLEYCMGIDPVCAGDSRCGPERGDYNDCVRAFCAASPDACSP